MNATPQQDHVPNLLGLFGAKLRQAGRHDQEYQMELQTQRRQQAAATELAQLLTALAQEMSLEEYERVEAAVYQRVLSAVHGTQRLAGLAAGI